MIPLRNLAFAVIAVVALSSCGEEEATDQADATASATGSLSPASAESGTSSQPTSVAAGPAASTRELFATIDAAVARESSVRQEQGNLNPPPPVVLEQEYGEGRDQLALTVDLGPQVDPLQIYHVEGLVYFQGEEPKPTSDIEPDETALIAVMLRSDVREDFQRMNRLADDFSYVGEEDIAGVTTHHYRMTLTLAPGANPASVPSQLKGPKPADLWIAATELPVLVDAKYSEPLNAIQGTGVIRTYYLAWR